MASASGQTWDIEFPFPVRERTLRSVAITPTEGAAIQRRQTDPSFSVNQLQPETREWQLAWNARQPATRAQIDRLEALWEATLAGTLTLQFTPPGGSAVAVHMMGEKLRHQWIGGDSYATQVALREARNDA